MPFPFEAVIWRTHGSTKNDTIKKSSGREGGGGGSGWGTHVNPWLIHVSV